MAAEAQDFSTAGRGLRRDPGLAALVVGFLLLVAAVLATILLTARQQQAYASVSHTLEAENQIALVLLRLQDAETGERGFLLTRRPEFLQPYENAAANVPLDLARLRILVADNPHQLAALARLTAVADAREDLLRAAVARFRAGETLPSEHFLRGRELMEEIRAIVQAMEREESRLLAERTDRADRNATYISGMLLASALLVIALGLFAFASSRRRLADAISGGIALAEANDAMKREADARLAAENQLRQLQKVEAVGQLTGGIAHDFNNMLAVIVGSLDMAAKRLEAGETARAAKNVDSAMDGARRAAQLTARLLAFSRQQALSPQPLDVNKLVGGMSELLLRTIGEQLRVETVLAGGLWRTFADPGQLENALVNLCVNARDAMPDGGKLTIETANAHLDDDYAAAHVGVEAGQYVLVSLTDTGTGMPPEVAERAFDPFFTTKAPGQGTGLGLSQVYGFVKQSRGHLKIYSEVGTGTNVKIYLPRFTGSAPERPPPPAEEEGAVLPHGRGETVLVVEDDERVRHVSVEALRSLGYVVVQAADAAQALAVLSLQPAIDLLFTDVVMPDKNGRQLAEEAVAARPGLKVLYTTGYTRNAIVHNGMLDAEVAFLAKPFTIEQLARKVRRVLDEGAAAG
jgi:signal transduction histidine kinase/ActR/RegA family two-component response regulator